MNALGNIAQTRYKECDQHYVAHIRIRKVIHAATPTPTPTHTQLQFDCLEMFKAKMLRVLPRKLVRRLIDIKTPYTRILLNHFLFMCCRTLFYATNSMSYACVRLITYTNNCYMNFQIDQWWLSGHCDFVLLLILLPKYSFQCQTHFWYNDTQQTMQQQLNK